MASRELLVAENAAKLYGRKLVFKDVSLTVRSGETWLVVGPNGAGKSTLLALLSGLLAPDRGRVSRRVPRGRIGHLGHATGNYPGLTARENLRFWAGMLGAPRDAEAVDAALARVGLFAAAEELAGRFSRGMAQRLALARILLQRPQLVFLDEPSTGLDAASRQMLAKEAEALRENGAALVWVSHDMRRDLPLADMVLELSGKRAAYAGPAAHYAGEQAC